MSRLRAKHANCSVVGCKNQHKSLHLLPPPEDVKTKWIHFIFDGNVPTTIGKLLYVCAHHFTSDCFLNEGQYKAGFASKLKLNDGSIPTVRDPGSNLAASTSLQLTATRDVACQTDPPQRHTVGTQLSLRTLQPHIRSSGVQATVSCKDFGVGTCTDPYAAHQPSTRLKRPSKRPRLDLEEEEDPFEDSSSMVASQGLDATHEPADLVTALKESTDMSDEASSPTHKIKKYIVFESCIMELFEVCPACQRVCDVRTRRLGTFLSVEQRCLHCQFSRHWNSQPVLGSSPAGNLQLSAAVYLSGASFFKLEKIFKAMQLQLFQYDTFRRHARMFIEPAVVNKWKTSQDVMLQQLSEQDKVIVGGDMRADSAGHSAKFGSYTVTDLKTNTVVDIQLVQSNEVGGSHHMEKEGLKRSLALLETRGVTLDYIVTDHHPQVQKFLRESNITHFYDVWHVERGMSKQLEKIAKMKDCEKLQKWMQSIKKHIYWTAASSATGPDRVAKWTSILNHVQDIHTHEDPIFPKCLHPLRQTRDQSKWLAAVLTNKRILKDVSKLSPHHQTSSLKAFHSVILRFAPKNIVFPFLGRLCRLYLAALHYNENADRPQATTSTGDPLFKVRFPNAGKGEPRAESVKTEPTFRYVDDLMDLIFEKVFVDPAPYTDEVLKIPIPEDLFAQYELPDKKEVIASYVSQFNQGAV